MDSDLKGSGPDPSKVRRFVAAPSLAVSINSPPIASSFSLDLMNEA